MEFRKLANFTIERLAVFYLSFCFYSFFSNISAWHIPCKTLLAWKTAHIKQALKKKVGTK